MRLLYQRTDTDPETVCQQKVCQNADIQIPSHLAIVIKLSNTNTKYLTNLRRESSTFELTMSSARQSECPSCVYFTV